LFIANLIDQKYLSEQSSLCKKQYLLVNESTILSKVGTWQSFVRPREVLPQYYFLGDYFLTQMFRIFYHNCCAFLALFFGKF